MRRFKLTVCTFLSYYVTDMIICEREKVRESKRKRILEVTSAKFYSQLRFVDIQRMYLIVKL